MGNLLLWRSFFDPLPTYQNQDAGNNSEQAHYDWETGKSQAEQSNQTRQNEPYT
jgi:hypothetical protein